MERQRQAIIEREVARRLGASTAYQTLSSRRREQLQRDLAKVVGALAARGHTAPARVTNIEELRDLLARAGDIGGKRIGTEVNFPDFVAGLIDGVFASIVDATIQQMDAYADLLANIAKSIDAFTVEDRRTTAAPSTNRGKPQEREHDGVRAERLLPKDRDDDA